MAQPSVAREPSMEEILASIRRIIESNEPGAPVAQPEPEIGPAADEVTAEYEDETYPIVADSMGMPLRAANSAVPPRYEREASAVSQPAEKPQSLADIAARVRHAAQQERPMAAAHEREEAPLMRQRPAPSASAPLYTPVHAAPVIPPSPATERRAAAAAQQRSLLPEMPLRPSAPLRTSVPDFDSEAVSAAEAMISRYEAPVETPAPVASYAVQETVYTPPPQASLPPHPLAPEPVAEPSALSLLSGETGAMVARSFSDLAEAVDGAQRRSLDEIAEELLRPMLREWLDDNLPTLVERLVREEIERVARGPRR